MKIANIARLICAQIALAIAPVPPPTRVHYDDDTLRQPAMPSLPGANIIDCEKVVPVGVRFASDVDADRWSNRLPERDLLSRPPAFGKMKGRVEVGPDMFGTAIVVRRIPKTLRRSTFGDFIQLKALCRRPVQRIARESIGHIDQLLLVDGIRCADQPDERQRHGKKRPHGLPPMNKREWERAEVSEPFEPCPTVSWRRRSQG